MGIYLGSTGNIELIRKTLDAGSLNSVINPSDINTSRNRFSFDFDTNFLITGDLLEISTTDGTPLDFIDSSAWLDNSVKSSGNWYVNIDEIGGIRLFSTFTSSLEGGTVDLITLTTITRNIPIKVNIRSRDTRLIASVSDYELNTNRETVDVTTLTDEHRQQYSSLISGSGRLTAHWDYAVKNSDESVHYLMQLVLRTEVGSVFRGKFYIKYPNTTSQTGTYATEQLNDAVWWEFDAVVTGSAVSFSTGEIITGTIDFVSTGAIRLKASTQPLRYLLQEDDFKIQLEQDTASHILLEEPE